MLAGHGFARNVNKVYIRKQSLHFAAGERGMGERD
jgi:hypothetical protein